MSFNIDEEQMELIQVVNDEKFDFLKLANENRNIGLLLVPKIKFLWIVLILSIKYPQVELYLKKLLNYFTINELEDVYNGYSIMHNMCYEPYKISLNSFEIIINYGVNINIKDIYGRNAAHLLLYGQCNNHIVNILNLLIKYGINLNIMYESKTTVLDVLTHQRELNEETKNCIMTIVDFGGITNNPVKNGPIYNFIEYYKCSIIKPAIKK